MAKRRPRAATNESIVESDPPVLEPIATTEPIAATAPQFDEETTLTPAPTKTVMPAEDYDEATVPVSPGAFDAEAVAERIVSEHEQVSVPEIQQSPPTSYENSSPPATPGDLDAAAIAKRVFLAPVENDDASIAPSLHPENIKPAEITTKETPAESLAVPEPKVSSAPATNREPDQPTASTATGSDPVAKRIAPPISGSTSQIDIPQGPTTSITAGAFSTTSKTLTKEKADTGKEPGKVSSWLKNKLRRNSKSAKPAISDPIPIVEEEKPLKGLTPAPVAPTSAAAVDPSPGAVAATGVGAGGGAGAGAGESLPEVDPLYDVTPPTTATAAAPEPAVSGSPSISTLSTASSSSERRGRSKVPRTHPAGSMEALRFSTSQPSDPVAVANLASNEREAFAEPEPSKLGPGLQAGSSTEPRESEDQFEEARDTVDQTALEPPPKILAGGEKGRGSPARDSRFSEDL